MADAAVWKAVDRRETNIEPVLPGMPKNKRYQYGCVVRFRRQAPTTKGNSEKRIAVIATYEQVEHDSRCARNDHRPE